MMQNSRPGSESGFTLLEILIAIAILAIISIAIYTATVKSFDINQTVSNEADDFLNITVGIAALERDIAQVYTPVLGAPKAPQNPQEQTNYQQENSPTQFWSAPLRSDGLRRTRFQGTSQKMTFVTNSNRRLMENAPESDFLAITWELEKNKSGGYTLYRSQDWDVFRLIDADRRKPQRVAVLTKINSGKFSFYRKRDKTWDDTWDTEGRFVRPDSRYPDLVSLKLEIPDPRNPAKNLAWEGVFRPNMMLNSVSKTPQSAAGGAN